MEFAQRLVTSKRGSLTLAIIAALLAGVLVLVYVKRYRDSVAAQSAPVTVLVAKSQIPKGTPGRVVAAEGLYTVSTIRESQLLEGAVSDPSSLAGRSATADIYPGQQLTVADFSKQATSVSSTLTRGQRVVSIPFDPAHGATPDLQVGDHVDVYADFNVEPVGASGLPTTGGQTQSILKLIMQDIPVIGIKSSSAGVGANGGDEISLEVDGVQAGELAYAADNGKLWLSVRPAAGGTATPPTLVTAQTLLLGVKPLAMERALGGGR